MWNLLWICVASWESVIDSRLPPSLRSLCFFVAKRHSPISCFGIGFVASSSTASIYCGLLTLFEWLVYFVVLPSALRSLGLLLFNPHPGNPCNPWFEFLCSFVPDQRDFHPPFSSSSPSALCTFLGTDPCKSSTHDLELHHWCLHR